MLSLDSKIETLPKTSKPLIAALKKLGLETVRDLLLHFPYRYMDFSHVALIAQLKAGEAISIKGTIKSINSRFSFRSRMSMAEAVVSDDTGSIRVVWFNQGYLAQALKPGDEVFLAGTPEYYNFGLQLTNPMYEKVSDFPKHTARLVPIYHLTQGLYPKTLRNLIAGVLPLAKKIADDLPVAIINSQKLLSIHDTINFSHFPESYEQVEAAKRRLAFEEIFYNQLLAQKYKLELAAKKSFPVKFNQGLVKSFIANLPFTLTAGQKKAAWDVLQDLEKKVPMNRLVEGDVGSGKTLVALIAALECLNAGLQVAFLAPTEILAKQHFETAKKTMASNLLGRANLKPRVCLLTHSYHQINDEVMTKAKLQALIKEGRPGLFIGTHALLADKVKFKKLALVVVDEQHRFGVEQRAALIHGKLRVPHLLSLTATPIPRTLQLAYYGELAISQIKSKPADRKPIITKLVTPENRSKAYQFISEQINKGRQAFVITPLVEESETLDVKSAKTEAENLKKIFPKFQIGLLHGRMSGKDKEAVMNDFLANKIQILVSTSVVEVGVDVPNASVMLIEGAERFGLAQLHQFRGRVGRAAHQSYCFLFPSDKISTVGNGLKPFPTKEKSEAQIETMRRLESFTQTQDGFALAELDLKQRGFGELYGSTQSGWNFKYFSPSYISLVDPARAEALKILENDLTLANYPTLKEKIAGKVIHFE